MANVATNYIYNKANENISYCFYNGGWSKWSSSKLNGGYAGDGDDYKYCVAIKFTTPAFKGTSKNFVLTIPYCRSRDTKQAADGTLKLKITTTDPRDSTLANALKNCNITADWSARNSAGTADREMHKVNVTFTNTLKPSTTYYIVIGTVNKSNNNDWIEIGEYTDEDKLWQATLTTYYGEGSSPTLTVVDRGNNTVLLSGTLGRNGTSNAIQSATLYYTTDGTNPSSSSTRTSVSLTATSGAGYSRSISITKDCTVKAYIVCEFEYNTTTATSNISAKYYKKPNNPGKPYLVDSSFKNGRLTVKQDWGWQWALATPYNNKDHNKVKGYHVRLYVNDVNKPIISYTTGKPLSTEISTKDWVYDRTATTFPMRSRATDHDIVPGDKIRLSVQAYSLRGDGVKLLSNETFTEQTYTVQNAGVVNVKVAGTWKEGQVYVKVSGAWKEAETVSVKVGGTWKESQ